jgi:hypothetical protein
MIDISERQVFAACNVIEFIPEETVGSEKSIVEMDEKDRARNGKNVRIIPDDLRK